MLPTPYSQDYLDLSSEIFSNGYGSGLVPFLGGCRGVTVVGGLGWVDLAVLGCEPPEAVLLCPAEGVLAGSGTKLSGRAAKTGVPLRSMASFSGQLDGLCVSTTLKVAVA